MRDPVAETGWVKPWRRPSVLQVDGKVVRPGTWSADGRFNCLTMMQAVAGVRVLQVSAA